MLKYQSFGHMRQRANPLEKTLMLGKTEDKRRREQQKMRWLNSIIDPMDVNLSKLWETVKDREAWHEAVHGSWRVRHDLATEQQWTITPLWKDACFLITTLGSYSVWFSAGHMNEEVCCGMITTWFFYPHIYVAGTVEKISSWLSRRWFLELLRPHFDNDRQNEDKVASITLATFLTRMRVFPRMLEWKQEALMLEPNEFKNSELCWMALLCWFLS